MPKKKITKKTVPKKTAPKKTAPSKKNQIKQKSEPDIKVKLVPTKNGLIEVKVKPDTEPKKDTRKYVKVYENDSLEKRKEVRERVHRKEIKFAYYASEGSQGVWYYVII